MPLPLDPNPEQSTVNKSKWGGIRKVVALPLLMAYSGMQGRANESKSL